MKTNQERLFDLDCRINDTKVRLQGAEAHVDKTQIEALKKTLLVMEEYRDLLVSLASIPPKSN